MKRQSRALRRQQEGIISSTNSSSASLWRPKTIIATFKKKIHLSPSSALMSLRASFSSSTCSLSTPSMMICAWSSGLKYNSDKISSCQIFSPLWNVHHFYLSVLFDATRTIYIFNVWKMTTLIYLFYQMLLVAWFVFFLYNNSKLQLTKVPGHNHQLEPKWALQHFTTYCCFPRYVNFCKISILLQYYYHLYVWTET